MPFKINTDGNTFRWNNYEWKSVIGIWIEPDLIYDDPKALSLTIRISSGYLVFLPKLANSPNLWKLITSLTRDTITKSMDPSQLFSDNKMRNIPDSTPVITLINLIDFSFPYPTSCVTFCLYSICDVRMNCRFTVYFPRK